MKSITYKQKDEPTSVVNEPVMVFEMSSSFNRNNLLNSLAQSSMDLFTMIVNKTNLTIKILAENIFEITPKTFIKYKNTQTKLPSRLAELAIELNMVYDLGIDVFGSVSDFNGWLNASNAYFLNKKPVDFLNTSTGISMITDALKRIEFGATA